MPAVPAFVRGVAFNTNQPTRTAFKRCNAENRLTELHSPLRRIAPFDDRLSAAGERFETYWREKMASTNELKMAAAITLREGARDDVHSLLEGHQKAMDALHYGKRSDFHATMTIANDAGDEFFEVSFLWDNARSALIVQRDWIEKELSKHGIILDVKKR